MSHRTAAALAASALALAGLAAGAVSTPAAATGGWYTFGGENFGAIPDAAGCAPTPGAPRDVIFQVSGMPSGQLADVQISGLTIDHTYAGDLTAILYSPLGPATIVFGRTGAVLPAAQGDATDLEGAYTFTDHATPASGGLWQAAAALGPGDVIPPGDYFATTPGGAPSGGAASSLTGAFSELANPNGTWTLRFTDGCSGDLGTVTAASLRLRTAGGTCAVEQSELSFQQSSSTAASTALSAAQQAAAGAAGALTVRNSAVATAKKAVKKAKTEKAKKRAKARLARAVLAQARAQGTKATADTQVQAASTALASAQAGASRAQDALAACQQE